MIDRLKGGARYAKVSAFAGKVVLLATLGTTALGVVGLLLLVAVPFSTTVDASLTTKGVTKTMF